ncbi:MAG: hypothetical protein ABI910_11725 [Gemmatimonadota bacterium]
MPRVWSASSPHTSRLLVSRESLWLLPVPGDRSERARLNERRGQLVLSAYAIYAELLEEREFEWLVVPVLRTLAVSSSRCVLVLPETSASFDAGRVRAATQYTRELGVLSMVEISGGWTPTQLELLAATLPAYLRLAPEMLRGAGSVPDVFRSLVALGEFARERGLELVARNPHDDAELDAVRSAGIGLVQWTTHSVLGA